ARDVYPVEQPKPNHASLLSLLRCPHAKPSLYVINNILVDLGPLRSSRHFRLLFYIQAMSGLAAQVAQVAVPVQVYNLTHSSLAVGGLGLAQLVPLMVFAITGGAIADAMDRRKLLMIIAVARAAVAVLLVVNALVPTPSLFFLYALTAAGTGLVSLGSPASTEAIPRLVRAEELVPAQAVMNLYWNISAVAGTALGGVLVASLGIPAAFAATAAGFLLAALMLSRMVPLPP